MRKQDQPYLGIVTAVVLAFWKKLPIQLIARTSVDDMISEVLLKLVSVSERYDSNRAAPQTFVYRVAHNQCCIYINRQISKKRYSARWVPWDDAMLNQVKRPDVNLRFQEAKSGVERVLQFASDELRREFAEFLITRRYHRWKPHLIEEARCLAKQHNVTYYDFLLVFRSV